MKKYYVARKVQGTATVKNYFLVFLLGELVGTVLTIIAVSTYVIMQMRAR